MAKGCPSKIDQDNDIHVIARGTVMNRRLLLAALLLLGCGPELDPPSLLERTRVVGAKVEVEGAPERATPRPGETATVTWLVTGPAAQAPLSWAFVVCPGAGGQPVCAGEPLALLRGHETAPVLKLPVPAAEHLAGVKQFVVTGRICVGSDPVIDDSTPGAPRCAGDGEGTTAAVSIPLDSTELSNLNPNLGAATLAFAGQPWTASDEGAPCAALPQVQAGSKDHVITLETAAADREAYLAMLGDPPRPTPQREWLQISQFTTQGKLDRSFSSIEATDTRERPAVDMKWQAPGPDKVAGAGGAGENGLVVRFVFVARDLRGGIDWTTRAVCVTN
jgi:hypothetical protein